MQKPPQAPLSFVATPVSVFKEATRLIEHLRNVQDQIVTDVLPHTATFANVILPLVHAENATLSESRALAFYQSASPNPELRQASAQVRTLLDDFNAETMMREDLFRLVDAVQRKDEDIEAESKYLLSKLHQEQVQNGLQLPIAKRGRLLEIKKRLNQVKAEFRENLTKGSGQLWFSPDELDGLPDQYISRLEKQTSPGEEKICLSWEEINSGLLQGTAKRGKTREAVEIASQNSCQENIPLFKEAIVLRDEAARLLGHPSHATLRMQNKMAKTTQTVDTFLDDLKKGLVTAAQSEVDELKQLKQADMESRGEPFDSRLFLWDVPFYFGLLLRRTLPGRGKIMEYFPLPTVVYNMLGIFESIFGMVFVEILGADREKLSASGNGDQLIWHADVQIFSVWNDDHHHDSGGFLGYLYLDLFSRDGKYGNPSNFNIMPGFTKEDGTRQYPSTVLSCNFTKATTTEKPNLLRHGQVVVVFHELGHCIHDLVSRTTFARFHGPDGTVVDFGEAPSQVLENWCWTPSTLKALSQHYSTISPEYLEVWKSDNEGSQPPENIPDELIETVLATRNLFNGLHELNQVFMSIFDMTVHQPEDHAAAEKMDVATLYNTLRSEIYPVDGPEALGHDKDWGHGYARFGHVIGEYDAGYYSYLLSNVYAADLFHTFFEADVMNKIQGLRYRTEFLEKGGSQPEMKTLTDFLGREPRTAPFLKYMGLA